MADDRDDVSRRGEGPAYRVHRAGDNAPPRATDADGDPPPYKRYRSKPRGLRERVRGEEAGLDELRARDGAGEGRDRPPGTRRRLLRRGPRRRGITLGRVVRWALLALGAWLALSLVLFLVSAQIESGKISDEAKAELEPAGYPLWSVNTILLLGSDARPEGTQEPGANPDGPSRADTMMLWRI
ncbi:MAG TPA: hypothetical protein VK506_07130, partial [Conexibacter sp.]|nr:hypothetical protein [Conexibacter sp.]